MRTPMHTDARDGLLLHVRGSKRVAFAPPRDGEAWPPPGFAESERPPVG